MTLREPYDDLHSFHRRWDRLDPDALAREAERQPLLFVADHVATSDRRAGSLVVHVRTEGGAPLMIVISDGPEDPTDDQCVVALATVVERIGPSAVTELGVVHHRRGRAHIIDLDRQWQWALRAVCGYYGIEAVGVLARTESGAILQLHEPPDG